MPRAKVPGRGEMEVPGADELRQLCDSAERVKRVCDAFGFGFRGYQPLVDYLTRLELELERGGPPRDGDFILPEEL